MSASDDSWMIDHYDHASPNIIYTEVNIPGPGADLEDFNSQFTEGCGCQEKCSVENDCCCVKKYQVNYDENCKLLVSKYNGPVIECNSTCSCAEYGRCGNRVVQFGPRRNLTVFNAGHSKGFGLKSETEIAKGEFICEYAGEVIGMEEARRRSQADSGGMNYIFVLNEYLSEGRVVKTCIDPSVIGNVGRYINHSCQPNSVIVPVRANNPVPKLCIFALRVIRDNEEITFDYGGGYNKGFVSGKRKPCFCGSSVCKQFLPCDETLF